MNKDFFNSVPNLTNHQEEDFMLSGMEELICGVGLCSCQSVAAESALNVAMLLRMIFRLFSFIL